MRSTINNIYLCLLWFLYNLSAKIVLFNFSCQKMFSRLFSRRRQFISNKFRETVFQKHMFHRQTLLSGRYLRSYPVASNICVFFFCKLIDKNLRFFPKRRRWFFRCDINTLPHRCVAMRKGERNTRNEIKLRRKKNGKHTTVRVK